MLLRLYTAFNFIKRGPWKEKSETVTVAKLSSILSKDPRERLHTTFIARLDSRSLRARYDEERDVAEDICLALAIIGTEDSGIFCNSSVSTPSALAGKFINNFWEARCKCSFEWRNDPHRRCALEQNDAICTQLSEFYSPLGERHIEFARELSQLAGDGLPAIFEHVSLATQMRIARVYVRQMHAYLIKPRGWEQTTCDDDAGCWDRIVLLIRRPHYKLRVRGISRISEFERQEWRRKADIFIAINDIIEPALRRMLLEDGRSFLYMFILACVQNHAVALSRASRNPSRRNRAKVQKVVLLELARLCVDISP